MTRAQAEPTVALVAVGVVVVALGLYATVLADAVPDRGRDVAGPTLERVCDRLTAGDGVAAPSALPAAVEAAPDGYAVNATLAAAGRRASVGPAPPRRADVADARLSVRLGPKRVRTGTLAVRVWR
ncbi:MAG: hypothetical protein ABEJ79_10215 [Halolamina sp.]